MLNRATPCTHPVRSKLRRRRLDGSHLAADVAFRFRRAFVDRVTARDKELAKVLAAKADVVRLLGSRDDEVHAARLVEDLDAKRGGDVEPAVGVNAETTDADFIRSQIQTLLAMPES